jgi:hypothetical protein
MLSPQVIREKISSFSGLYGRLVLQCVMTWQSFVSQTLSVLTEMKSHSFASDDDVSDTHTHIYRENMWYSTLSPSSLLYLIDFLCGGIFPPPSTFGMTKQKDISSPLFESS